jgi:hypothetical protein
VIESLVVAVVFGVTFGAVAALVWHALRLRVGPPTLESDVVALARHRAGDEALELLYELWTGMHATDKRQHRLRSQICVALAAEFPFFRETGRPRIGPEDPTPPDRGPFEPPDAA